MRSVANCEVGEVISKYEVTTYGNGVQELVKKTEAATLSIKAQACHTQVYQADVAEMDARAFIWPIYDAFEQVTFDTAFSNVFGLPKNLDVAVKIWRDIVYPKARQSPDMFFKYGKVSDTTLATYTKCRKTQSLERTLQHRQKLKRTMHLLAQLLLCRKGPGSTAFLEPGDIAWNWGLCREVFGQDLFKHISALVETVTEAKINDKWR